MAIRVEFNDRLRERTGGAEGLDVSAATVGAALIQVARAFPALHMLNCDGEVRSIFRVQKNGQAVPPAETLADGDILHLAIGA